MVLKQAIDKEAIVSFRKQQSSLFFLQLLGLFGHHDKSCSMHMTFWASLLYTGCFRNRPVITVYNAFLISLSQKISIHTTVVLRLELSVFSL